MITYRVIIFLGISQLVCWGITFYLIGVFGDLIMADLGWSRRFVHGGFSVALLVMGIVSPAVGGLIDRVGGARVMAAGSALSAYGCVQLALAETGFAYYLAWICLGFAMRATLYDAAFATLVRIAGQAAKRPIALITLFGGLASTCFWPIGHLLAEAFGWRGAMLCYAGFALLMVPLLLTMPGNRYDPGSDSAAEAGRPPPKGRRLILAAALYALIVALINGLNSGFSSHMIGVLTELGLAAGLAVTVSSLRGVGQTTARLVEVVFGGWLSPVALNLAAATVLPVCFAVGLAGGGYFVAAVGFTFFYGASIGILTITRGTLPLVLFDTATYGGFVGRLLVPGFFLQAAAPLLFADVIERFGAAGAFYLAIAMTALAMAASVGLKVLIDKAP